MQNQRIPVVWLFAAAADAHVLGAVKDAMSEGIVIPVLVGDEAKINTLIEELNMDKSKLEIVNEPDDVKACKKAITLIREGKAEFPDERACCYRSYPESCP